MKYWPFKENVTDSNGNKVYRDCLFVNMKTSQIQDHPDKFVGNPENLVISDEDIPKDCIVVDASMAPIVSELNKKGYRTIYSCQGHMDKNMKEGGKKHNCITGTYVVFEAPQPERYMENLINPPLQFEVRIESVGLPDTITEGLRRIYGVRRHKKYNKKKVSIYSLMPYSGDELYGMDQKVFDKYTMTNLTRLASWVVALPDLTKEPVEKSNALYDEKVIDKDTARQFGFEFDSVQDFVSDINDYYNVMTETINEINREMSILNDMVESISIRLSHLKVVDDIRKE